MEQDIQHRLEIVGLSIAFPGRKNMGKDRCDRFEFYPSL